MTLWLWLVAGQLVVSAWTICICVASRNADQASATSPQPERTAAMCEYGVCRERWTALVDLGSKGNRYVCDAHVDIVVRETVDPDFEAFGVGA